MSQEAAAKRRKTEGRDGVSGEDCDVETADVANEK